MRASAVSVLILYNYSFLFSFNIARKLENVSFIGATLPTLTSSSASARISSSSILAFIRLYSSYPSDTVSPLPLTVIRTDNADALIHKITLDIAEKFGVDVALERLDKLEEQILLLGEDPHIGSDPRYMILRRQGYKILITEKNLVFYKIDEYQKIVTVYAVVDQRQDYLNIIRGL